MSPRTKVIEIGHCESVMALISSLMLIWQLSKLSKFLESSVFWGAPHASGCIGDLKAQVYELAHWEEDCKSKFVICIFNHWMFIFLLCHSIPSLWAWLTVTDSLISTIKHQRLASQLILRATSKTAGFYLTPIYKWFKW